MRTVVGLFIVASELFFSSASVAVGPGSIAQKLRYASNRTISTGEIAQVPIIRDQVRLGVKKNRNDSGGRNVINGGLSSIPRSVMFKEKVNSRVTEVNIADRLRGELTSRNKSSEMMIGERLRQVSDKPRRKANNTQVISTACGYSIRSIRQKVSMTDYNGDTCSNR
jgi:hypothetical protein